MFWGCWTYEVKGPCYVYRKETAAQTKAYSEIMKDHNLSILVSLRAEFDIKQAAMTAKWAALGRKKPGKAALFDNFVKYHPEIMKREKNKGGIDHMRYRHEVVEPLIIPFLKALESTPCHDPDSLEPAPKPIFQQDNAPSHNSRHTLRLFEQEGIQLLEHPGNSPDMSAIEKEWMPLRIAITNQWNRPHTLEWTARAWEAEWEKFPIETIRGWFWDMIKVNQLIIDDEGGNKFHG